MINACCVLHNYCNLRNVPLPAPVNDIDGYFPPLPELNDLPLNIQQRGLAEMQCLIDFANQRENEHFDD